MKKYGEYYWCVKVSKELSSNGEILLHADQVNVENGDLIFREEDGMLNFSIAKGTWTCIYAASCIDGESVNVEHWEQKI